MVNKLRGKWALGITPRNLTWIIKDRLAVCERPGGFGDNHRRVRRQEEIIWLRENGFDHVVSILEAPYNLHNYEELGLKSKHRPLVDVKEIDAWLKSFYSELHADIVGGSRVLVHADEVSDLLFGIIGGYIRWSGLVDDPTQAIIFTEGLGQRHLDPSSRMLIMRVHELR